MSGEDVEIDNIMIRLHDLDNIQETVLSRRYVAFRNTLYIHVYAANEQSCSSEKHRQYLKYIRYACPNEYNSADLELCSQLGKLVGCLNELFSKDFVVGVQVQSKDKALLSLAREQQRLHCLVDSYYDMCRKHSSTEDCSFGFRVAVELMSASAGIIECNDPSASDLCFNPPEKLDWIDNFYDSLTKTYDYSFYDWFAKNVVVSGHTQVKRKCTAT